MSQIKNPHDKYVREVMSDKDTAIDFFLHYLPDYIRKNIDLNSLSVEKDSFIDEELTEFFSDMLYKVNINNSSAFIYLLFEHKSYIDNNILLQLLSYMVQIWKKHPSAVSLPIIIPYVFYHGSDSWNIPANFSYLFEDRFNGLDHFIPGFEYSLYDLSAFSQEQLLGEANIRIMLNILKHIHQGTIETHLESIFSLLNELSNTETAQAYFMKTLLYLLSVLPDRISPSTIKETATKMLSKERSDFAMSIAERLKFEGKAEGKAEGKVEGICEGLETILKIKFGKGSLFLMNQISKITNIDILEDLRLLLEEDITLEQFKNAVPSV